MLAVSDGDALTVADLPEPNYFSEPIEGTPSSPSQANPTDRLDDLGQDDLEVLRLIAEGRRICESG